MVREPMDLPVKSHTTAFGQSENEAGSVRKLSPARLSYGLAIEDVGLTTLPT